MCNPALMPCLITDNAFGNNLYGLLIVPTQEATVPWAFQDSMQWVFPEKWRQRWPTGGIFLRRICLHSSSNSHGNESGDELSAPKRITEKHIVKSGLCPFIKNEKLVACGRVYSQDAAGSPFEAKGYVRPLI